MDTSMTVAAGCYHRHPSYVVWTGDPPSYTPMWPPAANPQYPVTPVRPIPSIAEQMGVDPISKLAAAIEKLADALKGEGNRD
jgi:hypothetical protein